jgi:hypothetical protein
MNNENIISKGLHEVVLCCVLLFFSSCCFSSPCFSLCHHFCLMQFDEWKVSNQLFPLCIMSSGNLPDSLAGTSVVWRYTMATGKYLLTFKRSAVSSSSVLTKTILQLTHCNIPELPRMCGAIPLLPHLPSWHAEGHLLIVIIFLCIISGHAGSYSINCMWYNLRSATWQPCL